MGFLYQINRLSLRRLFWHKPQTCLKPDLSHKRFRQLSDGASGHESMPQYLVWECPVTYGLYSFLVGLMRISAGPKCELCHIPVSPAESSI